jgi:hypothetical protein
MISRDRHVLCDNALHGRSLCLCSRSGHGLLYDWLGGLDHWAGVECTILGFLVLLNPIFSQKDLPKSEYEVNSQVAATTAPSLQAVRSTVSIEVILLLDVVALHQDR